MTIPDECPSLQLLWPPRKPRFQVVSKGFRHLEYLQGRGPTLPAHHSPSEHWYGHQQPPFALRFRPTGPGDRTRRGYRTEVGPRRGLLLAAWNGAAGVTCGAGTGAQVTVGANE